MAPLMHPQAGLSDPAMRAQDFFAARLVAMSNAGASDAQIERETALSACVCWLDESDFTADDLFFIAAFIGLLWPGHPAALFAQLHSSGAAGRFQADALPAAPTPSPASPA